MKKILFLSLLSFLLCISNSINAFQDDPPIVIIIQPGHNTGGGPRGLDYSIISGFVFEDEICLYFQQNMGIIELTLTRGLDGVILQTDVNSSLYYVNIPFSSGQGLYTITLVTEGGDVYEGYFEIS